jgi:FKBP-type peptidyl-prolyl cis-trans isomerase
MAYPIKNSKKYIQPIIILSLLMNILISCDQCFFKETNTGLQYKLVKKGDGTKPQNGQLLLIDMSYQTKDKKVLREFNDNNSPVIVYDDKTFHPDGGIYEAISMLGKDDTFIFKLPAKPVLGNDFEELAPMHNLKEDTLIYVRMHVRDIQNKDEFKKNLAQQHKAMIEKQKEETARQLPKDIEIINKYLTEKHLDALSTQSGLRYMIDKPGKGGSPKAGNIVKVNYVGKTLEGQIFDTNIAEIAQKNNMYDARRPYEPLEFKIGEGGIIPGFEEGIKLLKKHAKAHLFIPSVLAYGPHQIGKYIMPNSNLIFEIELVDIITE